MTAVSSIPPQYNYESPFPSNMPNKCCYLTREPISKEDEVFFFQLNDGSVAPAKLQNIFAILNLNSDQEKDTFVEYFFALDNGEREVLLWRKLSRYRRDLFQLLLGHFSAH